MFSRFPRSERSAWSRRAPPGWRHCRCFIPWNGRPTNLEPTFRDNLARPFSTPASWEWVVYRERTFRAVHFDSSNRHRTCRRYEMFTRQEWGDVLKVVQTEGVVELARWQIPNSDTRYCCLIASIASKLKILFFVSLRQV